MITNKTLLEEIDAETNHRLGDEEGYHSLYGAPVLIVISSARDNNFAKQDCSAANENMGPGRQVPRTGLPVSGCTQPVH